MLLKPISFMRKAAAAAATPTYTVTGFQQNGFAASSTHTHDISAANSGDLALIFTRHHNALGLSMTALTFAGTSLLPTVASYAINDGSGSDPIRSALHVYTFDGTEGTSADLVMDPDVVTYGYFSNVVIVSGGTLGDVFVDYNLTDNSTAVSNTVSPTSSKNLIVCLGLIALNAADNQVWTNATPELGTDFNTELAQANIAVATDVSTSGYTISMNRSAADISNSLGTARAMIAVEVNG